MIFGFFWGGFGIVFFNSKFETEATEVEWATLRTLIENKCGNHVNAVDNVDIRLLENINIVLVTNCAHHYVFRLEVLMNYVLGVEVKQPVTHAHDDGAFVFRRQLWRKKKSALVRDHSNATFAHLCTFLPWGMNSIKK